MTFIMVTMMKILNGFQERIGPIIGILQVNNFLIRFQKSLISELVARTLFD